MIEDFHAIEPYSLEKEQKEKMLLGEVKNLIRHHIENCEAYKNILNVLEYDEDKCNRLVDLPFIPVRLFKELELKSIKDGEVFKVMTSSGTTNQVSSKVYLNKDNAILQQKVLLRLLGDFIGKKRLPMLVIDTEDVIKNRKLFSARGATIMGLDFAARGMTFALDSNMKLKTQVVDEFLEKYGNEKFLIFGFTFMVWQHFFDTLEQLQEKKDFSNGYLLTGGGWKKLESQSVSREMFKQRGKKVAGITQYVDHYSMAEQSGSIYAECPAGHLHASVYSDVIVRKTSDFSVCDVGEEGVLQVVSALPRSYPGNVLLTEDRGIILGEDDCPCGRKGKYIKVLGRIKNAEIRGCSDTYAAGLQQN